MEIIPLAGGAGPALSLSPRPAGEFPNPGPGLFTLKPLAGPPMPNGAEDIAVLLLVRTEPEVAFFGPPGESPAIRSRASVGTLRVVLARSRPLGLEGSSIPKTQIEI